MAGFDRGVSASSSSSSSSFSSTSSGAGSSWCGTVWGGWRRLWIPTSDEKLARCEAALLGGVSAGVREERVPLAGKEGHFIHTLRVPEKGGGRGRAPILLLHGFFMGAASWAGSLDALAETGREVLSVDWPGSGRSSRPAFPRGSVEACEDYFVEHLEAWRRAAGIQRMVLLGHSFGGYFAALYTMRYPQHVEALILASPVGMGGKKPGSVLTDPEKRAQLPLWRRGLLSAAQGMWEGSWTPQGMVRFFGPFGGRLTRWYVDRRFQKPREAGTMMLDGPAVSDYMYQLAAQPACSERCLGELLDFGAWAKQPLAPRLAARLRELGPAAPPVAMLYGEHDWMDVEQGAQLAEEMRQMRARRDPDAEVLVVEGAGHQLFIDHPQAFNAAIRRLLGQGPPSAPGLYRRFVPGVDRAGSMVA